MLRQATARVRLLRDGLLQVEQEIHLKPGTNSVGFRDRVRMTGSHTYELVVDSRDDTLAENNLLQAVLDVKGPPRVLVLAAERESQRFFSRALRAQGYAVVDATPQAYAMALGDLSSFDLLALDNVPTFQLTHAKMERIEK